jgi:hypothetical protein
MLSVERVSDFYVVLIVQLTTEGAQNTNHEIITIRTNK